MSKEALVDIIQVLGTHSIYIEVLKNNLIDQLYLVEQLLPKCSRCKEQSATVKNKVTKKLVCDRCVSELIVLISKDEEGVLLDEEIDVNVTDWIDVENANRIRKISDYISLVKHNNMEQQ